MGKKFFLAVVVVLFVSFSLFAEDDYVSLDIDSYLDYELIQNDVSMLKVYKIMNETRDEVLSVERVQRVVLTNDRKGLYYLKNRERNEEYSALWYYNSLENKSSFLLDVRPTFRISKDDRYLLYYVVIGQYSVDDIRIIDLETLEEVQYFSSVDIINEKYPGVDYPEYCALLSLDNFDENGVDIAFNRYWEWDEESFTIFISFDDLSYEFTDRMDLFSDYWEDWR